MACILINCCIISAKAINLYFKPCWAVFVAYLSRFSIITVIVEIIARFYFVVNIVNLIRVFVMYIFNLWQQNYLLFAWSKLFCENYRSF